MFMNVIFEDRFSRFVHENWRTVLLIQTVSVVCFQESADLLLSCFIFQEPEEELQDMFEYLYFLIISPDKHCIEEKFVCWAVLLQHPYYLNGYIAQSLYHSSLCQVKMDGQTEVDLSNLPTLDMDMLRHIQKDIVLLQCKVLQNLLRKLNAEANEQNKVKSIYMCLV